MQQLRWAWLVRLACLLVCLGSECIMALRTLDLSPGEVCIGVCYSVCIIIILRQTTCIHACPAALQLIIILMICLHDSKGIAISARTRWLNFVQYRSTFLDFYLWLRSNLSFCYWLINEHLYLLSLYLMQLPSDSNGDVEEACRRQVRLHTQSHSDVYVLIYKG